MTAQDFTKTLQYLPKFMRDFHDQKDLFKSIEQLYGKGDSYKKLGYNWRDNHIFTIDFFLWFMGQHGYTLQKSRRKDVDFFEVEKTIETMLEKRLSDVSAILFSKEQPANPLSSSNKEEVNK